MSRSTPQRHFSAAAEFASEYEWQGADRQIISAIRKIVEHDIIALKELIESMPAADKAESTSPSVLRATLITTPIPAFVDSIAAQSKISADALLKPTLRTLRVISAFATTDNYTLEKGLPAARHLIKSGRTIIFEYRSHPPGSNWTCPAHGIF